MAKHIRIPIEKYILIAFIYVVFIFVIFPVLFNYVSIWFAIGVYFIVSIITITKINLSYKKKKNK